MLSLPDLLHNDHLTETLEEPPLALPLVYSTRHINSPFEDVEPPNVNHNCSQVSIIRANVGRLAESCCKRHTLVRLLFQLVFTTCTSPAHPLQPQAGLLHSVSCSHSVFLHLRLTSPPPEFLSIYPVLSFLRQAHFCKEGISLLPSFHCQL